MRLAPRAPINSTFLGADSSQAIIECLTTPVNCSTPLPLCTNSPRFDFPSLWAITQRYREACPDGPWLYHPVPGQAVLASEASLTNAACEAIAGKSWTKYAGADIWARLTTWKFPLLQLVATSPRPPLGFRIEVFVIFHQLGNPIGTIQDHLQKFQSCQRRATYWRERFTDIPTTVNRCDFLGLHSPERLWKAFAIITDSYDEWGVAVGDDVQDFLRAELYVTYLIP